MKRKAEQQDVRMKFFTDNIQLEGSHKGVKYMRGVVNQVLLQFFGKCGLCMGVAWAVHLHKKWMLLLCKMLMNVRTKPFLKITVAAVMI